MTLELVGVVSFFLLAVGLILTILRLAIGPDSADRIIALDLLSALAIGFVGVASVFFENAVFLDVAVILSLVVFLGTVAFARYLDGGQAE